MDIPLLGDFLSYGFIKRAILAGSMIGLLCSMLGVVLVLRRLSLIGDGLAHVTFGSAAAALFLRADTLAVSIPIVTLCSISILKLIKHAGIYGDAAIGIVSSAGIALGVLFASFGGGLNVDLFSFLFGSILAISVEEVYLSFIIAFMAIMFFFVYYREILSVTFDADFAKVSGVNTGLVNNIIAVITAVTVVLAMKIVGIMLTSSLLILPPVTAFQLARSFKGAIIIATLVSVVSVNAGIALSFIMNIPTGALTVFINLVFFGCAILYKKNMPRH